MAGAATYCWWINRQRAKTQPISDGAVDSDQKPPKGTAEYVGRVINASVSAPPGSQLKYVASELTIAQVLSAEVGRLNRLKSVSIEATAEAKK